MGMRTVFVSFIFSLIRLHYTDAVKCLRCNDVINPYLCSRIEQCPEGEICVIESYRNGNGQTFFNVGCMSEQKCSLTDHRDLNDPLHDSSGTQINRTCTECCHGDLCNAAGCGIIGFPQQRGPICLACAQSRDLADCDTISVCDEGEVCHIEEVYEFGDLFYKTSCVQKTDQRCVSSPTFNPMQIGRRSAQDGGCFSCCPDDLCNTKCNINTSVAPSTVQPTTSGPIHHGFKGTEFFLMFIENFNYNKQKFNLSAIVTSSAPDTQLQVITRDNSTSTLVHGPVNHIVFDANMTMRNNGKTEKGIIVTSNTPISVTGFNFFNCCLSEDYLALPIESLGVSYVVGTFKTRMTFGSTFAVGAPYDNTMVNITLSVPGMSVPQGYHKEGDTITVNLNKLETFYFEKDNLRDLTGTRIDSDKPVAVVSGNRCSGGFHYCNHLVEYLPPVSKWGSKFMVPPLRGMNTGYIRIVSSVNNTNVIVTKNRSPRKYSVSILLDITLIPAYPYEITSDYPIMVLLLPIKESIAMTIVPSIDQFSQEPVLISPPIGTSDVENYIVVSIRSHDQSGLKLRSAKGVDLPRFRSINSTGVDGDDYTFITASCNNNQTCSVQHSDTNVKFGVIAYGFRKPFQTFKASETYAYPGNLQL